VLRSERKHRLIKEVQAAVGWELAARSEIPKTLPQRIADLVHELTDACERQITRSRRVCNVKRGSNQRPDECGKGWEEP
jgi:hypothetical protein